MMRTRRLIWRVTTVAVILVAGLEAALQAAHAWAARRAARAALSDPGAPVVLCLGDSHTYGAGVTAAEAYPAQLEALLRARGYRVNVVNLGVPGMNTSEIRRALPGWLKRFSPVAVIVLAGVNNGWNRRDAAWSDAQDGVPSSVLARIRDSLAGRVRLVRAALVFSRRLELAGPGPELAQDRTGAAVLHYQRDSYALESREAVYDRARRDLTAIIAQARANHVTAVLMTYVSDPEFDFATPNRLLREAADFMNAPLADNDLALRPLLSNPDGSVNAARRESMFFPDMHPRALGYEKMAPNIAAALEAGGVLGLLPRN
jgi:lysophospholipase L1-like esterase